MCVYQVQATWSCGELANGNVSTRPGVFRPDSRNPGGRPTLRMRRPPPA